MASPVGGETTSRAWSCSTLTDGLEHLVQQARQCEDQELRVEQMIQDSSPNICLLMIM